MLKQMSSAELVDWMAYEKIAGPLGGARADYHAAQISAAITNGIKALAGKRGDGNLSSHVLKWDNARQPEQQQSPQDMKRQLRGLNKALGGKVVHRGDN